MRGDATAVAWKYFEEMQTINTVGGEEEEVGVGVGGCRGCSCSLFREMVWIKVWTGTCWS